MLESFLLFLMGGGAYVSLEILWRGTSHWSMFLAGGVCLCLLSALARSRLPLWTAALAGAGGVTALELAVGAVCRYALQCPVWDYSREWGNLAGLICPRYSLYWLFLCGWVVLLLRTIPLSSRLTA